MSSAGTFSSVQTVDLFGPEADKGISFFSGGRTAVNVGVLSQPEITAILSSYNSNLGRIKHISPEIYADLVAQQNPNYSASWQTDGNAIALKFATIAKGTLASQGGTKPITWPPIVGQIGVQWLDPYLLQYSSAKSTTNPTYTDYNKDCWNLPFNGTLGNALAQVLGSSTFTKNTPPATSSALSNTSYYQASNNVNQRELFFIFQNGVLEIGTTPDIQQWILQTSLTQAYSAYTTHSLVSEPINNYKNIYQYNTPCVIPVYNDMGTYLAGLPQTTTSTHTMPVLGMAFYETALMQVPQFV